jgi:hypothetical protein
MRLENTIGRNTRGQQMSSTLRNIRTDQVKTVRAVACGIR